LQEALDLSFDRLLMMMMRYGSLDVLTRLWAGQPRDGLNTVRAKKCFFSTIAISALGPFRLGNLDSFLGCKGAGAESRQLKFVWCRV